MELSPTEEDIGRPGTLPRSIGARPASPVRATGTVNNRNHHPGKSAIEIRPSPVDYAMSVIVVRAFPAMRNGLEPAHRRIHFGTHEFHLAPNCPHPHCHHRSAMASIEMSR